MKKFFVLLLALTVAAFGFVSCNNVTDDNNDSGPNATDIERLVVTVKVSVDSVEQDFTEEDNTISYDKTASLVEVKVMGICFNGDRKDVTSDCTIMYRRDGTEIKSNELFKTSGRYEISVTYSDSTSSVGKTVTITKERDPNAAWPIDSSITLELSKATWAYDEEYATITYKTHPDNITDIPTDSSRELDFVSKDAYDALTTQAEKVAYINDDANKVEKGIGVDSFTRIKYSLDVGSYYVFVKDNNRECYSTPIAFTITKGTFSVVDNGFDWSKAEVSATNYSYGYDSDSDQVITGDITLADISIGYIKAQQVDGEDIRPKFANAKGNPISVSTYNKSFDDNDYEIQWKNPDTPINASNSGTKYPIILKDLTGNYNDLDFNAAIEITVNKGQVFLEYYIRSQTEDWLEDYVNTKGLELTGYSTDDDLDDFRMLLENNIISVTRNGSLVSSSDFVYESDPSPVIYDSKATTVGKYTYVFTLTNTNYELWLNNKPSTEVSLTRKFEIILDPQP